MRHLLTGITAASISLAASSIAVAGGLPEPEETATPAAASSSQPQATTPAVTAPAATAAKTAPRVASSPRVKTASTQKNRNNDYGFYVKVLGGTTKFDRALSNLSAGVLKEDDDDGYSFATGFKFSPNLKVEGFYSDLGKSTLNGSSGQTFSYLNKDYVFTSSAIIEGQSTTIGFAAIFTLPLTENTGVFAKVGMHSWENKIKIADATASANVNTDGADLVWGLGADYQMSDNFNLFVGYDVYTFGDENVDHFHFGTEVLFN